MLATPTGRRGVLLVRLAALVTVALALTFLITSAALQLTLVGGGDLWWLVELHLAGLPYLVACTTLGLLAGSILPTSIAKPTATGLEWVGLLTITHYYPALEIANSIKQHNTGNRDGNPDCDSRSANNSLNSIL